MTQSLRANPAPPYCVADPQAVQPVRQVGSQALSRASGAPLVPGNRVRILEDAEGNYPVWLEAIASARRTVYFENYIFEDDEVGRLFAEALIERARAGVRVRLIRDWLGSFRGASRSFWRRLSEGGVDVRAFNPPRLGSPFGWVTRDHRKVIAVDGRVAFVTGLCVSQRWKGDPARGIPPWRDTGVEIRGPAVADVEHAFADLWESIGAPIPADERAAGGEREAAGDVALRVIAGVPSTAGLFRLDQLVAAVARRTLWLTDAYFVGVTPYVQALRAAARDGVDVRLLVPNATDLPLVQSISRAGYRPLLEAGVRIFEWNGSMLHAKTAVADGRWTRIGSSNLNIASYLGNYEMDVAIEDETVARQMEEIYERDLSNATEVRLARHKMLGRVEAPGQARLPRAGASRASGRAAVGAIRVANAVGAAVTNHRVMDRAEARLLLTCGLILTALAVIATIWPRVIAVPLSLVGFWVGGALVWRARTLVRRRSTTTTPPPT